MNFKEYLQEAKLKGAQLAFNNAAKSLNWTKIDDETFVNDKTGNRASYIDPNKIAVSDKTDKTIVQPTLIRMFDDVTKILKDL